MIVTREQYDEVVEAVWAEIEYQNNLLRRTDVDEAQDVPGFLTLGRRYLRKAEDAWADSSGLEQALHHVRKLAAIFARAMIYCGIRHRRNGPDRRLTLTTRSE